MFLWQATAPQTRQALCGQAMPSIRRPLNLHADMEKSSRGRWRG